MMIESMFNVITHWLTSGIKEIGLLAVFIGMIIESACIPLPSEIIMPLGGLMVQKGNFSILSVTLAGTFGNTVGGALAYYIGKTGGRSLIKKYGRYVLISEKHLSHANTWFNKRGEATVFWSRLLPGVRTFISLPAGIAHMDFGRFLVYTTLGSFPWALGMTYIGFFFGQNWNSMSSYLHEMNYILWALSALGLLVFYRRRRKRVQQRKVV